MERNFPFEFFNVDQDREDELNKYFDGRFVLVGPKAYCMPLKYKEVAADIYNMPLRATDTFIVTFPRSGTTLTQEMVWLIGNDLDYERAAAASIVQRFPFLEFSMILDADTINELWELNKDNKDNLTVLDYMIQPGAAIQATAASPRFIKTHLPFSLLPPALLDTTKVLYVARDPRDVAVSFYNLFRLFKPLGYTGDFKAFWNLFINDLVYWTPFFEHIKEGWEKRHHPNVMFLFYEDIVKDMPGNIGRVASFLGKQLSAHQLDRLCQHLSIDNFRHNKSVNDDTYKKLGCLTDWDQPFIRKGKTGGWRGYFDAEMTQQAERWMADNMRDTDLAFPQ